MRRGKWGAPDAVGIYRPEADDIVPFAIELVAVEVKADPRAVVEAFGQATSYRLFANRVYLALPTSITRKDREDIVARCCLFGIGLILFDPSGGDIQIQARAQSFRTDMFYTNQFAHDLRVYDAGKFNKLFGGGRL